MHLINPFWGAAAPPSGVTWNPADMANTGNTLSNGNLTIVGASSSPTAQIRATVARSSGKFYWEVSLDIGPTSSFPYLGIRPLSKAFSLGAGPFASGGDYGLFANSPNTGYYDYEPGSNLAGPLTPALVSGTDVFMFAVDLTGLKFWIGRNGTWDSGSPSAGTGQRATIAADTYAPWTSCQSVTVTARFASSSWAYTAPTGFVEWA